MPEISELSQYQQSADALAPLVADQGTWFDPAPLPQRPPVVLVPERGADAWLLSALTTALPSALQQLLATPPRALAPRVPAPALDLRPLGQSSPVGVLGWELPGARPPPPVPRNPAGADWPLRAFTASTPLLSTLDQPANRPPPGTPARLGAPALELQPFTASTPLLPGLDQPTFRPSPAVPTKFGAPALELRPFTSSTPLLPVLDQPTARGPAAVPPPRPMEQAQPLGPGIVLPTGWDTAFVLSPPPVRARMVADAFALAPLAPQLGVTGWEVPPLPPRAPAPIPRPSPLAAPPGTIIPLTVNPSSGWEPQGRVPPRVPWIQRVEQADPPGNFLFPPSTSSGWEPQGAVPRAVPRVARFEIAAPIGAPVVVLAPIGQDQSLRPPPALRPNPSPQHWGLAPLPPPLAPWFDPPPAPIRRASIATPAAPPLTLGALTVLMPFGWIAPAPPRRRDPIAPFIQTGVVTGPALPPPALMPYFDAIYQPPPERPAMMSGVLMASVVGGSVAASVPPPPRARVGGGGTKASGSGGPTRAKRT